MTIEDGIKLIIEIIILGLEIYFVYWIVSRMNKVKEDIDKIRTEIKHIWEHIDEKKKISELEEKVKEIERQIK